MTQIESKPASSASRTIRASVGPIASVPPGHVNDGIWRPTFIGTGRSRRPSRRRAIVPSPSGGLAPRTSATGRPAVLPSASSAADASSSATARTVVRMTRPSASGWPRRSSSGRIPDTPSATSTMPQRHGRPKLSETMTGRSVPKRARSASRMRAAEASGSTGSSVTRSPESGPTFEASMPPFAHTNPCRVSVISTPRSMRTIRLASRRTTSIWRASRSHVVAHSIACGDGSTVRRSTTAPSALDTTFWVTTRTSPGRAGSAPGVASSASPIIPSRSSPSWISGRPASAITSTRAPRRQSTCRASGAAASASSRSSGVSTSRPRTSRTSA